MCYVLDIQRLGYSSHQQIWSHNAHLVCHLHIFLLFQTSCLSYLTCFYQQGIELQYF